MKRRVGVWVVLSAFGCSSREGDVPVRFSGQPPYGAFYADTRAAEEICPWCGRPVRHEDVRCSNVRDGKPCRAPLRHLPRVKCEFCGGTKKCDPCAAFETSGRCRYCLGGGRYGDAPCFNCGRSGRCAACGGSAACDACGGTGEIALPWSKKEPQPPTAQSGGQAKDQTIRPDRALAWLGETVAWSGPNRSATWIVYRAARGEKKESERVTGDPARCTPAKVGSYVAVEGAAKVFFDVVEVTVQSPPSGAIGSGTPLTASVDFAPPLKGSEVRWELVNPGGRVERFDGASVSANREKPGRYELWPMAGVTGIEARRGPQPVLFDLSDFRITGPKGPFRAGVPVEFKAVVNPPILEEAKWQWTLACGGEKETTFTEAPSARLFFPRAGKYAVQARCGSRVSAPLEAAVYSVTIVDAEGKPIQEARLASLEDAYDDKDHLREEAPAQARERVRVVVEDPDGAAPAFVRVSTRRRDGAEMNPPVRMSLLAEGDRRATRSMVLLGDQVDDAASVAGRSDDAPDDPTFWARPAGHIEVAYRGAPAASVGVGPFIVYTVPVRFFVLLGEEGGGELERTLDARLEQANAVWEPFGLRFARASIERVPNVPRNLLLVTGRAAGVDEFGHTGRAGARIDGSDLFVPTGWRGDGGAMTPVATAAALTQRVGSAVSIEVFEKLFPADREAVVIRLRRRDGKPLKLEPLVKAQDISQSVGPLPADYSDGCDIAPGKDLSLEEIGILLGCREERPGTIDVFIVKGIRRGDVEWLFKSYPDSAFPPLFARAAVVSWKMMDASGRWPYMPARALGEVLRPAEFQTTGKRSLFSDPPVEQAGPGARRRVGTEAGAKIYERGRGLAAEK